MSKELADKTIQLAKEAWVHRNSLVMTEGSEQEKDRLLAFHDTLVSMATQLYDEMEQEKVTVETYYQPTASESLIGHIVEHMMKKGWTEEQLAEQAGIRYGTISRLLSGSSNPQHRTLRKIESALGLKEGHLDGIR